MMVVDLQSGDAFANLVPGRHKPLAAEPWRLAWGDAPIGSLAISTCYPPGYNAIVDLLGVQHIIYPVG
jgi:hypothetical protein